MKTVYFPENTRGNADYGWLQAKYAFSFGNFYDAKREQFGKLRVLNDDIIAPSKGFGTHPHRNMEIISIPLSGALAHKDSLGHESIIHTGEVQVMSAGSGIEHSEYNPSDNEATNLLQIWLFPNKANVMPRYDQKTFDFENLENNYKTVVGPENFSENALWIHQDAYLSIGNITAHQQLNYSLYNEENLVYLFLISGKVNINDTILSPKDAFGVWETENIALEAEENAKVLIIETPK